MARKTKEQKVEYHYETEDRKMKVHGLTDEMEKSYLDYSMSVIVGRALPDVRDGMKPVHRRILYGMQQLGITPDKPHKKSARIVGEVMGKYHPHGDSSIYDAMVRMAQDFSMRYPLVDGHGNFGSIDGDGAAAQRYTEARMSPFSMEMVRDIEKDTVDFMPNFDGEEMEPTVLPSRYPNLLVNGSSGIAVGMATNIPPHNLGDAIDAAVYMIEHPDCTVDDLIPVIKGPDFPTGAQILGKSGIREFYRTGTGRIRMRAKCSIEPFRRGREQIIITEIPYGVNKAKMIEKMAELVKSRKIQGITEIRDESSREGIRIVIELRKDANAQIILNNLYKYSSLQENFGAIMLALVDGKPKTLNLREVLEEYIRFQKEVVTRRTEFDLKKARERAHILEGLLIALDNIDEVIRVIRSAYDDAREQLMKRFGLDRVQAQAILDMRLARLQGLEREKLQNEFDELKKRIARYEGILASERKLMQVIRKELLEIRKNWSDPRRTEIVKDPGELDEDDLIVEEDAFVSVTARGYAKRVPDVSKAVKPMEDDYVKHLYHTTTKQTLLVFTDVGKMYRVPVLDLQESTRSVKGTALAESCGFLTRENFVSAIAVGDFDKGSVFVITDGGAVKRIQISDLDTSRRNGISYTKLKENEKVVDVVVDNGEDLILATKRGKGIRFSGDGIRAMGRAASGVRGIRLDDGDLVTAVTRYERGSEIVAASSGGFIKRFRASQIPQQARGGKGVFLWEKKSLKMTGPLTGIVSRDAEGEVVFLLEEKCVVMKVEEVPEATRAAAGIRCEFGESVISCGKQAALRSTEDMPDPTGPDTPDTPDTSGPEASEGNTPDPSGPDPEVNDGSEKDLSAGGQVDLFSQF